MKKILWILVFGIFLAWQTQGLAETTVDSLIKKLVEKGILSTEEATQIKGEIAKDEKKSQEEAYKKQTPEWQQNTKLTGDFRVRNQFEHRRTESASETTRDRARMRARLGIETKINDQFKMAVGIATDGGSARSSNYTFDSNFGKGNVVLNYAYGQYAPNDKWTFTAGQMKNPIWEPMEFLWDSDITPQGGSVQYNYKLNDSLNFTGLGAAFVVKELAVSNADPFIWLAQAGFKGKASDKFDYKLMGLYQGLQNTTKIQLQSSANNTTSSSNYVYRYNVPGASVEFGINNPMGEKSFIQIPRLALFGEYVMNPNPKDESTAWMTGFYLGNPTVSNKGSWKATWAYKSLGRDAWVDVLPDSDFYSGNTDVKGMEAIMEYGLAKNVIFAIDYYHTQRKSSLAAKQEETLLQTDINFKF